MIKFASFWQSIHIATDRGSGRRSSPEWPRRGRKLRPRRATLSRRSRMHRRFEGRYDHVPERPAADRSTVRRSSRVVTQTAQVRGRQNRDRSRGPSPTRAIRRYESAPGPLQRDAGGQAGQDQRDAADCVGGGTLACNSTPPRGGPNDRSRGLRAGHGLGLEFRNCCCFGHCADVLRFER